MSWFFKQTENNHTLSQSPHFSAMSALAMLDAMYDPLQAETVWKQIREPLIDVESSDAR